MHITKLSVVFFSATGRTRKAAEAFVKTLPLPAQWIDVTAASWADQAHTFGPEELVVFAAPVYGGRIPVQASQRFARQKGAQTPAVLLAVFGNRDYDDALLEMQEVAQAAGFVSFACAAPVAEHSLMPGVAVGRPDEADTQKLAEFAGRVWQTLAAAGKVFALKFGARKEPEFFIGK